VCGGARLGSNAAERRGLDIADPLIGLAITIVILKITWDSWHTVRAAPADDH
jgi:divalent metal cation (Fe/Co/Zn/Cd) transporter